MAYDPNEQRDQGGKWTAGGGFGSHPEGPYMEVSKAENAEKAHTVAKPKGKQIMGHSLATWAKSFADDDAHRIEAAIRNGLLSGMENTEVARQVVGSQRLNGVDGTTEITRRHIAQLGRVTLKKRSKPA